MLRIVERTDKPSFPREYKPTDGDINGKNWKWVYGGISFQYLYPAHQEGNHGGNSPQFQIRVREAALKQDTDLRKLEVGIEILFSNQSKTLWFNKYLQTSELPVTLISLHELFVLKPEMAIEELAATAIRLSSQLNISYDALGQQVIFEITGGHNDVTEVSRTLVEQFFTFETFG